MIAIFIVNIPRSRWLLHGRGNDPRLDAKLSGPCTIESSSRKSAGPEREGRAAPPRNGYRLGTFSRRMVAITLPLVLAIEAERGGRKAGKLS